MGSDGSEIMYNEYIDVNREVTQSLAHMGEAGSKGVFEERDEHEGPCNDRANDVGSQQQSIVAGAKFEAAHVDGTDCARQLGSKPNANTPA